MTESARQFLEHVSVGDECLNNFDAMNQDFALRHVWIVCVSAFDRYLTQLVSEAGLRLIDRTPPVLTQNLRQVEIPLVNVLTFDTLTPAERLIFFREHIFSSIQYKSFYRPDKVSEALSYIWTCPPKEKWDRIVRRMKNTGRYDDRAEEDVRGELALIGDRRDLIAHAVDIPPGTNDPNPANRDDAARVVDFIRDLGSAIDAETEAQLAE